jgi:hypothetical protein
MEPTKMPCFQETGVLYFKTGDEQKLSLSTAWKRMGIIRILNLDIRWKIVVNFTLRLLYQRDKILSGLLETWSWERWVMANSRQVTTNLCCVTSEKREQPPVFSKYEAGWASDPVWTQGRKQKSLASAGNRTMTALFSSPCPDRYIDYVVLAPFPTGDALILLF